MAGSTNRVSRVAVTSPPMTTVASGRCTSAPALVETAIGLFMQSPETYAQRMVPLLFAPELEGRTGLMFGHKAQPIKPTQGLDSAYIHRYLSASDALLRRALS